ncbi:MAG: hypothetical protein AB1746_02540 [Candidatus Zixiibacteriota bacterium]
MKMEAINKFILNSPIPSTCLSLISIILAFVFYYLSKKKISLIYREPYHFNRDKNIVSGRSVKNRGGLAEIISLNIALWNNGRDTIHKRDIARNDPIILTTEYESPILHIGQVFSTRKANNVKVNYYSDAQNKLEITFDYLDPKDGLYIPLYFEGDIKEALNVKGSIIGMGGIFRKTDISNRYYVTLLFCTFIFGLTIFYSGYYMSERFSGYGIVFQTFGVSFYPAYAILMSFLRYRPRVPKKLKGFSKPPNIFEYVMKH